jgi:hypothetical protein
MYCVADLLTCKSSDTQRQSAKSSLFCVVKLCNSEIAQGFVGTYRVRLQGGGVSQSKAPAEARDHRGNLFTEHFMELKYQ